MTYFATIGSLILIVASNSSVEVNASPTGEQLLGSAGADPTVAVDTQTGARYAAWIRPGKSSGEVVVARSDKGQNFADPVVASGGEPGIVSATVNPAQVAVGTEGEVYVLYERRVASPIYERGCGIPRLARSSDGGRSFAAAVDVVAADAVETSAECRPASRLPPMAR